MLLPIFRLLMGERQQIDDGFCDVTMSFQQMVGLEFFSHSLVKKKLTITICYQHPEKLKT
jgi:hypothetical protein